LKETLMPLARWNGVVLAESDRFEEVEGNIYFPPDALNQAHFKPSDKTTFCGWKGTAEYFTIEAGGEVNENAAWVYRDPKSAAANIKDHVAFWRGVEVER
ncbi:MAG: DUF427 domain-containing protein, partial [Pseudomonadota bacterium]